MASGRSRWAGVAALLLLAACARGPEGGADDAGSESAEDPGTPVVLVGASGDTVRLEAPPRRIVALIPGVNQILLELGAVDRIVGRTDYDTVQALRALPSVGGGIGANLETLAALRPDLVVRFEGAQDARTAARLDDLGIPHLGVRPDGIEDIRRIYTTMGTAVEAEAAAAERVAAIDRGLDGIRAAVRDRGAPRVAWLLGGTPPLAAGPGTFLEELVEIAGGIPAFDDLDDLYVPVSMETLLAREIDVIVTSEGAELDARIIEGRRVARVPSWVQIPGPGIVASARRVAEALHPGLELPAPVPAGGDPGGRP